MLISNWSSDVCSSDLRFALTSGSLAQADFLRSGRRVDTDRMNRNLASTRGLIVAEAVMMALAPHTGRQRAHDIVYAGCRRSADEDRPLFDVLVEMPEVFGPLGRERLVRLVEPANYVGIDRKSTRLNSSH